jgi:hypothetical protein
MPESKTPSLMIEEINQNIDEEDFSPTSKKPSVVDNVSAHSIHEDKLPPLT